jgi:sigma-B regulation protein RsbU (phosphoserine phosphatase)
LFYHRADDGSSQIETIHSEGMALGMVPPEMFDLMIKDQTVPFRKDDALILYTDGVTESVNAIGEEYSNERLIHALETHGDGSAQFILEQIMASVRHFSGQAGQADDLTLVAIKHS